MRALTQSTRPSRPLGAALAVVLASTPLALVGASAVAPAGAAAPPGTPALGFHEVGDGSVVQVRRPAGGRAFLPMPAYVTPTGGTFDLKVDRPDFDSPLSVTQVVHDDAGGTTEVPLPELELPSWRGLPGFFDLTVTDRRGAVVHRQSMRFCPNSYAQQRIDPDGTDRSSFPQGCRGLQFMHGHRWGIDEGWASRVGRGVSLKVPKGRYTMTMSIAESYRELWNIAEEQGTTSATYRVRNGNPHGDDHDHDGHVHRRAAAEEEAPRRAPRRATPVVEAPAEEHLPDLRALPAFGIDTRSTRKKDWLAFGANVWVGGNAVLDVEGFRRKNEAVMDAWQYFYDGDEPVGRAPVGEMEYDTRDGHFHWHLLQFARYQLLDASQENVTRSKKQSFCIVPTDPVDLSLDGAETRPYETGLDSACGDSDALWIRETLPVGWGDTYYQERGGQAFNITKVPNGTYFIAVEANPTRELFETDKTNNVEYRRVILKGKRGERSVCVPGHGALGLDQHGTCGKRFG
jgi:hypothetical protein